jgi:hypothetical protein
MGVWGRKAPINMIAKKTGLPLQIEKEMQF